MSDSKAPLNRSCPTCHSSSIGQTAPLGTFQCHAHTTEWAVVNVPTGGMNPLDPRIPGFRSEWIQQEVFCGTQWFDPTVVALVQQQQGDHMIVCECGDIAIGKCAECAKPVCMQHGVRQNDRRLCPEHRAPDLPSDDGVNDDDGPLPHELAAAWLDARSDRQLIDQLYPALAIAMTERHPTNFAITQSTVTPSHFTRGLGIGSFRLPGRLVPPSRPTHHVQCQGWLISQDIAPVPAGTYDPDSRTGHTKQTNSFALGEDGGYWHCVKTDNNDSAGEVIITDLRHTPLPNAPLEPGETDKWKVSVRRRDALIDMHVNTENLMRQSGITPEQLRIDNWPAVPTTLSNRIPKPFETRPEDANHWT